VSNVSIGPFNRGNAWESETKRVRPTQREGVKITCGEEEHGNGYSHDEHVADDAGMEHGRHRYLSV
jgi:hypothetical protein